MMIVMIVTVTTVMEMMITAMSTLMVRMTMKTAMSNGEIHNCDSDGSSTNNNMISLLMIFDDNARKGRKVKLL